MRNLPWNNVDDLKFLHDATLRVPKFNLSGAPFEVKSEYVRDHVWKFQPAVSVEIKNSIAALKLPDRYVSMQVRRGGKQTEHPFVPLEKYVAVVGQWFKADPSLPRVVYVATDSAVVVDELHKMAPDNKGHFQQVHNKWDVTKKKEALIDLLIDLELVRKASFHVCTFSSNMGRWMRVLRRGLHPDETTVSVDLTGMFTDKLGDKVLF